MVVALSPYLIMDIRVDHVAHSLGTGRGSVDVNETTFGENVWHHGTQIVRAGLVWRAAQPGLGVHCGVVALTLLGEPASVGGNGVDQIRNSSPVHHHGWAQVVVLARRYLGHKTEETQNVF